MSGHRLVPLALASLIAACVAMPTSATPSPPGPLSGGTLTVAQASDIVSLDPWTASDPATVAV
ncbi:MAG: hypothetical protein E6J38_08700, partial [Chloroflexi bacterium]